MRTALRLFSGTASWVLMGTAGAGSRLPGWTVSSWRNVAALLLGPAGAHRGLSGCRAEAAAVPSPGLWGSVG